MCARGLHNRASFSPFILTPRPTLRTHDTRHAHSSHLHVLICTTRSRARMYEKLETAPLYSYFFSLEISVDTYFTRWYKKILGIIRVVADAHNLILIFSPLLSLLRALLLLLLLLYCYYYCIIIIILLLIYYYIIIIRLTIIYINMTILI